MSTLRTKLVTILSGVALLGIASSPATISARSVLPNPLAAKSLTYTGSRALHVPGCVGAAVSAPSPSWTQHMHGAPKESFAGSGKSEVAWVKFAYHVRMQNWDCNNFDMLQFHVWYKTAYHSNQSWTRGAHLTLTADFTETGSVSFQTVHYTQHSKDPHGGFTWSSPGGYASMPVLQAKQINYGGFSMVMNLTGNNGSANLNAAMPRKLEQTWGP